MPHRLTIPEAANFHAVFNHIRNDINLRHAVGDALTVLLDLCVIQIAEPAGEGDQVEIAQALTAKQQHLVIDPRAVDGGERLIIDRTQIDIRDLSAKPGRARRTSPWHHTNGDVSDLAAHGRTPSLRPYHGGVTASACASWQSPRSRRGGTRARKS